MDRIEEFVVDNKNFIYFDMSNFKENTEYKEFIEKAKRAVSNYKNHTLYTITNIKNVMFDTDTKKIVAEWMEYNKPYVKCGAVTGVDGIKKIMVIAVFKLCGRKNMIFAATKEQAIEALLKRR